MSAISAQAGADGFRIRNARFLRLQPQVWHVVEFQKSTKSTAAGVVFTVNIGVASLALTDDPTPRKPPSVQDCHIWWRLTELLGRADDWWIVENELDASLAEAEIARAWDAVIIPLLAQFGDDDALMSLWRSRRSPGATRLQRLMWLSRLQQLHGDPTITNTIMELHDFARAEPALSGTVEVHLRELKATPDA